MKKKYLIILIALVSVLGISLYVAAYKEESVLDKIFNKDVEDITYEELQQAKEEHLRMETSSEELDEYEKKLKEIIMEKNETTPSTDDNKSEIDFLIEKIQAFILFIEDDINYSPTISKVDEIRDLYKQQAEAYKNLLIIIEKKEETYEYYSSIFEQTAKEYGEKYIVLRDKYLR